VAEAKSEAKHPLGAMQIASHKHFAGTSEGSTAFINHAEFSAMGMDVFMDVGVIPVDSLASAMKIHQERPDEAAPVDFYVTFRFGMSVQTAVLMCQRLTQIVQQFQQQLESTAASVQGGKL
jgi:hypothetical protein